MAAFILTNLWLVIKGIGIGFVVAAPVGPIGVLCIRLTLERGRVAGFCAGLGAACADTVFAAVGAFSLSVIHEFLTNHRHSIETGGAVVVAILGIILVLRPAKIRTYEKPTPEGLIADFLTTFILTLANPITIFTFIAIFAGFAGLKQIRFSALPVLLGAIFIGSSTWWLMLSEGVGMIRHRISPEGLAFMNRLAGALMVGFGVLALSRLLR
ncbi:MAG TPA: LysE family transporter [Dongiaceae bacterium]|nr:LysE family transporter [Dongiaceae bacterium]